MENTIYDYFTIFCLSMVTGIELRGAIPIRIVLNLKKVEDSIEETLTYCDFPSEHWTRIRTNNVIV